MNESHSTAIIDIHPTERKKELCRQLKPLPTFTLPSAFFVRALEEKGKQGEARNQIWMRKEGLINGTQIMSSH
jgi:hypothetical protein